MKLDSSSYMKVKMLVKLLPSNSCAFDSVPATPMMETSWTWWKCMKLIHRATEQQWAHPRALLSTSSTAASV